MCQRNFLHENFGFLGILKTSFTSAKISKAICKAEEIGKCFLQFGFPCGLIAVCKALFNHCLHFPRKILAVDVAHGIGRSLATGEGMESAGAGNDAVGRAGRGTSDRPGTQVVVCPCGVGHGAFSQSAGLRKIDGRVVQELPALRQFGSSRNQWNDSGQRASDGGTGQPDKQTVRIFDARSHRKPSRLAISRIVRRTANPSFISAVRFSIPTDGFRRWFLPRWIWSGSANLNPHCRCDCPKERRGLKLTVTGKFWFVN